MSTAGKTSPGDIENMKQSLFVAERVLQRMINLLDNHITSNKQLTVGSRYFSRSTIGKHLRHARDYYELLIDSISSPPRILNYDVRIRNTPMETSRTAARDAVIETIRIERIEGVTRKADKSHN
ncbi:hypothetical protein K435DRAFT_656643 [Dendrothele bispora CBS 962.96]|uniref:Uncharacterized protein n=1 Tax=Dendrothele bispora (strain CBS 962.96) TaxID=1314807 RepID=A0A4S8MDU8_DENBC|nr:hypothetical protein K435DRAFT_656643 [Dendrothele bispora CBS 962.96]